MLIRVQHWQGRNEPLERLLSGLPPAVEVITDSGETHNPWRGYRRCLSDLPESGHVVVIQDDAIVCRNFAETVESIAASDPGVPTSLFTSKAPRRTYNMALLKYGKSRYVDIHPQDLVHVVAIVWPVEIARSLLRWVDENPYRIRGREFVSDDATVTRWMRLTGQRIRCAVPSIVQHPDDVPSVVNAHRVAAGKDSGRTAALWIGDDDPLALDWSR